MPPIMPSLKSHIYSSSVYLNLDFLFFLWILWFHSPISQFLHFRGYLQCYHLLLILRGCNALFQIQGCMTMHQYDRPNHQAPVFFDLTTNSPILVSFDHVIVVPIVLQQHSTS